MLAHQRNSHSHEVLDGLGERWVDSEQVRLLRRRVLVLHRVHLEVVIGERVERDQACIQPSHVQAESSDSA